MSKDMDLEPGDRVGDLFRGKGMVLDILTIMKKSVFSVEFNNGLPGQGYVTYFNLDGTMHSTPYSGVFNRTLFRPNKYNKIMLKIHGKKKCKGKLFKKIKLKPIKNKGNKNGKRYRSR